MNTKQSLDGTDAQILLALAADPRATVVALAERLGMSRNTVQARLAKMERNNALGAFERRITPGALGYPLTAFVTAQVDQHRLAEVSGALAEVAEVVEVFGLSGETDLLVRVVATDAEDLYRVAGKILAIPGIDRTATALAMRELVPYRLTPLLRRAEASGGGRGGGAGVGHRPMLVPADGR
ncbi:Lrp/AsnC family transcriptional regulator [Streptomyces sp. NBC_00006]|uniref:Lrp/AsnC family transcriptional regulator n=1 Tax=unclassified Streptomyces TaxID=2593676 RepID=UPI00224CB6D1|nr:MULTISPECIES: Lrp/AsnC family transcriptional regulator [unclassified Streptomyces]MCX4832292.1 Lrp/AsnC family transcriptional regulator [Streptomyces sp. NBC_01016]MCX5536815.1 Lrp/AsnC family transcriptional regulator [Streptomyces sp. NBC_00006]